MPVWPDFQQTWPTAYRKQTHLLVEPDCALLRPGVNDKGTSSRRLSKLDSVQLWIMRRQRDALSMSVCVCVLDNCIASCKIYLLGTSCDGYEECYLSIKRHKNSENIFYCVERTYFYLDFLNETLKGHMVQTIFPKESKWVASVSWSAPSLHN